MKNMFFSLLPVAFAKSQKQTVVGIDTNVALKESHVTVDYERGHVMYNKISGSGTKCANLSGDNPEHDTRDVIDDRDNSHQTPCRTACDLLGPEECYGYSLGTTKNRCIIWKEELSLTTTQPDGDYEGCWVRISTCSDPQLSVLSTKRVANVAAKGDNADFKCTDSRGVVCFRSQVEDVIPSNLQDLIAASGLERLMQSSRSTYVGGFAGRCKRGRCPKQTPFFSYDAGENEWRCCEKYSCIGEGKKEPCFHPRGCNHYDEERFPCGEKIPGPQWSLEIHPDGYQCEEDTDENHQCYVPDEKKFHADGEGFCVACFHDSHCGKKKTVCDMTTFQCKPAQ